MSWRLLRFRLLADPRNEGMFKGYYLGAGRWALDAGQRALDAGHWASADKAEREMKEYYLALLTRGSAPAVRYRYFIALSVLCFGVY